MAKQSRDLAPPPGEVYPEMDASSHGAGFTEHPIHASHWTNWTSPKMTPKQMTHTTRIFRNIVMVLAAKFYAHLPLFRQTILQKGQS